MRPILGCFAVFLLATATSLVAAPITLNYQIVVTDRLDFTLPPTNGHWEAITPVSFPLSMTFDSQVTRTVEAPAYALIAFGHPSYTDVPLAGAGLPADHPYGGSYILNNGSQQGAYADGFLLTTTGDYAVSQRGPRLFADLDHTLPPGAPGDLSTFVDAMRSPNLRFEFYDYAYDWRDGSGGRLPQPLFAPNSAGYVGSAKFVSIIWPTPEPSTWILLGTAVLGLAAFRSSTIRRHAS